LNYNVIDRDSTILDLVKTNLVHPKVTKCTSRFFLALMLSITTGNSTAHENTADAVSNNGTDITEFSIEQLLDIEVFTSSRFPQKASEAPSRVTVIDSEAIKKFGYRTLSDILNSIPGLYTTYDRNYTYLGARGFGIPGDYNTRFLMLLDGKRVNDNIYDSFGIDYDGIVNVDLIERVEFSAGPGSAVYGANAFFGVINVITRSGDAIDGVQVSADYGSENSRRARVTAGNTFDNGIDALISASVFKSDGADIYYPEFDDPSTNNGVAVGLDYHEAQNVLLKLKYQDWGLSVAYNERTKGIPTASYEQEFNTPPSETIDTVALATLTYEPVINKNSQIFSSLLLGQYKYEGDFSYDYPPLTVNRDESRGGWVNAEIRYLTTRFERQKITVGAEYQKNDKQDQANFDVDPFFSYLDDSRNSKTLGLYVQDEIRFSEQIILNAGIRYDNNSIDAGGNNETKNSIVNPRLALIYSARPETTLKLIYGTAYRNPNAYELYYGEVLDYLPSTDLKPEEIETYEFNVEHFFNNNFRLTTAVFFNDTRNLIGIDSDPATGDLFFNNFGEAQALGAEIEAEYVSDSGLRLRTSYSYVNTEDKDTGKEIINSPNSMVKMNLSAPVLRKKADAGLEFRYMSERATEAGAIAGGYGITNITLSSKEIYKRLVLSASLYNLFDRQYFDPVSDEHTQDSIEQDSRTFRLKATYTF